MTAAIVSTVTQKVRAFLSEQGVRLEPWSGLDETYVALYALLNLRRDDPSFWPSLVKLLDAVVAAAVDPDRPDRLPAPEAELLRSWDIDRLVDDLREALPGVIGGGGGGGSGGVGHPVADAKTVERFAARLSATVLGGFMLLGLAAAGGCSDDASRPASDAGGGEAVLADGGRDQKAVFPDLGPWYANCGLAKSQVLYSALDQSSLTDTKKRTLCQCFDKLSTSWSDGLTDLFQNQPPSVVALALEAMIKCCGDPVALGKTFSDVKSDFFQGKLCKSIPLYKGVSFPRR